MNKDQSRIWTSVDLHQLYDNYLAQTSVPLPPLSRCLLVSTINDHFGEAILEIQIQGCASLLCFRQYSPHKLCKVQEEDDSLENVIRKIKQEVKQLPKHKDYDLSQFIETNSVKLNSPTLLSLISSLVSNNNITKPSLTISQIIQSHITVGLGVKVYNKDGSKESASLLHEHGLIVPYDEVIRFKTSAAKYIGEQDHT